VSGPGIGAGPLLRMSAGAFVWASAFVALYAGYSLGCQNLDIAADAGRANPVTLALVAVALAHGAAMAWLLARWLRHPVSAQPGESDASRRFRHRVEGLVLWVSTAALVFVAFPVLMVSPCVG
jgi:hypothetical protein